MPHDIKQQILEEAVRRFAAKGYDGASIQSIADAVGVTKQSVLYHFPTKKQLHGCVVDLLLQHWEDELPRLLAAEFGGQDRFSSTLRAVIAFFMADEHRARLTIREMLDRPAALRAVMEERLAPWTRLLGDYIRMGQRSGIVRADVQPEAFIVQVMMMIVGFIAVGDVAAGLVRPIEPSDDDAGVSELVRIARQALYAETSAPSHAN